MAVPKLRLCTKSRVWPPWLQTAFVPDAELTIEARLPLLTEARSRSAQHANYLKAPLFPKEPFRSFRLPSLHNSGTQIRAFSNSATSPPQRHESHESLSKWMPPIDPETRPVTIIGAGVLGRRLAVMWASTSRPVNIYDTSPKALTSATTYVADELSSFCATHSTHPGHVHFTTDLISAVAKSWLVIEAVPENLELKTSVLGRLDRIIPSDAILATNSSSYKARELVGEVVNKHRVLNMLYSLPPQNICVELMSSGSTIPEILPFLAGEMSSIGLHPIIVESESTGLIFNRIWAAIKRETLCVLEEGVGKPEDIDELFRDFFGAEKGPCKKMDEVGLDNVRDVERLFLEQKRGDKWSDQHLKWLEKEFVAKGKLGEKSGEGLITRPTQKDEGIGYKKSEEVWKQHTIDVSGL